jgi:hypothetical protein
MKGQSLITIIIILVIVGLISGGLYYYFQKQISEFPEITKKPAEEGIVTPEEITPTSPPKEESPKKEVPPEEVKSPEEVVTPPCQNECSPASSKRCSNNGYQVCGNYDEDSCLEWSSIISCLENTICQNGDCIFQEKSVAIFIDADTYNQTRDQIEWLKLDIINDLATEAQTINVYIFKDWGSKEEIKNKIINLWKTENLIGVILIGDVPSYTFSSKYYPAGMLSDFYYMDVENTCKYPTPEGCSQLSPKIWLGRITPPMKGKEGIELLRNYLERNHNYRTGKLSFSKEILFYFPSPDVTKIEEYGYRYEALEGILRHRILDNREIYNFSPDNVLISKSGENLDNLYLEKLKKTL